MGARIKTARSRAGLTLRQVADHFGVVVSTVLRWENGESELGTERIEELAEFFGAPVTPAWLAFGDHAAAENPQRATS